MPRSLASRITCEERYKAPIHDYASLHKWSVEFPENFWNAVWDFCEIRCSQQAQQTIEDGARMPGAKWFVDALLNYAENLIPVGDDSTALIFRNEAGERRELTHISLRNEVARVADGLKQAGVKVGDRVAGYLPNIPETVIAMLATTSLGAIWSSYSPEFGARAVVDRFGQIKPRVLFVTRRLSTSGQAHRLSADRGGRVQTDLQASSASCSFLSEQRREGGSSYRTARCSVSSASRTSR